MWRKIKGEMIFSPSTTTVSVPVGLQKRKLVFEIDECLLQMFPALASVFISGCVYLCHV